jgi:signal transduction histidine kinase
VAPAYDGFSLTQLEQRLETIDADLEQLARYSLRSGVGPIGFRSISYDTPDHAVWVEVDLGRNVSLDEVVLVPTVWRDTKKGVHSDGFPESFRVLAGTADDRTGQVIYETRSSDGILPRIAPLGLLSTGVTASWVRVESSQLAPRAFDGRFVFQLAEILVFSGAENAALRCPVSTSLNAATGDYPWAVQYLTDGSLPYLMNSSHGEQSIAYLSPIGIGEQPSFVLDLQQPTALSELHLHAVDQGDTVPQSLADDFGIPRHLMLEGAGRSDFSDARVLLDVRLETVYEMGPLMAWRFPESVCRYVRLTALEPYLVESHDELCSRIGFAEIELFSKGRNVALNQPILVNFKVGSLSRSLAALTDGRNLYGDILPIRDWMNQLAQRHDLETERPLVAEELARRYGCQKANISRLSWIVALLAAGIGFTILVDRLLRQRAVHKTRERIAADLHDELGANLHAIGLLGAIAEDSVDVRDDLIETVRRIRELTRRTGAATRLCTNMLEARGLCEDLVEEMKRASYRLLADLQHEITIEGPEQLQGLRSRKRIDLFLFYKECLTNIIRHSGATQVVTSLCANRKGILLVITDNGTGTEKIPASLRRRARLLGARVTLATPEVGGTCITLRLRTRFNLYRRQTET